MSLPLINTWQNFNRDQVPPVLTVDAPGFGFLDSETYISGLSATDNLQGDITSSIALVSDFPRNRLGTFDVDFIVRDSSGNAATITVPIEIQGQYKLTTTPYHDPFDEFGFWWTPDSDHKYIVENGKLTVSENTSNLYFMTVRGDSDAHMQLVFNRGNNSSNSVRLVGRYVSSSNYIEVKYYLDALTIELIENGQTKIVAEELIGDNFNQDLVIGAKFEGEQVTAYIDGVEFLTATTSNSIGAKYGIVLFNTEHKIDDFRIAAPVDGVTLLSGGVDFPPPNTAPSVVINAPTTLTVGQTAQLSAEITDDPEDTHAYAWGVSAGSFDDPTSATPTVTAPATAQTITYTLTVTDNNGLASDEATATTTVTELQAFSPTKSRPIKVDRRLKVSKTDGFELDARKWTDGEAIASFQVLTPDGKTSVVSTSESGGIMRVLLTGIEKGAAEVHFEYATATRDDCTVMLVIVVDDC